MSLPVLIGCEESAVVRDAFRRRGFDAWSCDMEPTRGDPRWHIQGDVRAAIRSRKWSLVIMHEPCTFIANSSAKHLYVGKKKENGVCPDRWSKMEAGADFMGECIRLCDDIDVPSVHENPIMLGVAQERSGWTADQTIQLYWFGHREMKSTCLCLRGGVPPLAKTDDVGPPPPKDHPERKSWEKVFRAPPSPTRQRDRSETRLGVAEAMAEQWGRWLLLS